MDNDGDTLKFLKDFVDKAGWDDERRMPVQKALLFYDDAKKGQELAEEKMKRALDVLNGAVEMLSATEAE